MLEVGRRFGGSNMQIEVRLEERKSIEIASVAD
jgi:hypothetical protein